MRPNSVWRSLFSLSLDESHIVNEACLDDTLEIDDGWVANSGIGNFATKEGGEDEAAEEMMLMRVLRKMMMLMRV